MKIGKLRWCTPNFLEKNTTTQLHRAPPTATSKFQKHVCPFSTLHSRAHLQLAVTSPLPAPPPPSFINPPHLTHSTHPPPTPPPSNLHFLRHESPYIFFFTSPAMASAPAAIPFRLVFLFFITVAAEAASTYPYKQKKNFDLNSGRRPEAAAGLNASARYEGSSDLVHLRYHMGPVLSSAIKIHLIWYGRWSRLQQRPIRDFLLSLSDASAPAPSAAQWWSTVALYTDQTGANVTRSVVLAREYSDRAYSRGRSLTRLSIQQIIAHAVPSASPAGAAAVDHKSGIYLVLTSPDVQVQDFCRAVCGFHYFTFPSLVGYTLPYAWIGNSGKQCADVCAYPFAIPAYMSGSGTAALKPPNGDVGVDGMISVIAHELAELSSNPLINAWYAGDDPTAPTEIGDLCEGLYGSGGGGGYIGQVSSDGQGRKYNVNGRAGRRFLVQWVWSPVLQACAGPNALD